MGKEERMDESKNFWVKRKEWMKARTFQGTKKNSRISGGLVPVK